METLEPMGTSPIGEAVSHLEMNGVDLGEIKDMVITEKNLPERRNIPDEARTEIVRVFNIFLTALQKAQQKRAEWNAVVKVVREQLGIHEGEVWDIDNEAKYFEKRETPVETPAQYAGEGEDSSLEVRHPNS